MNQWLQGEPSSVPASASWALKVSLPVGLLSSCPTFRATQEMACHYHLCTCLCFALPFARAYSHFSLPAATLPSSSSSSGPPVRCHLEEAFPDSRSVPSLCISFVAFLTLWNGFVSSHAVLSSLSQGLVFAGPCCIFSAQNV